MTMVDSRTNLSRNTIRAVRDAYGSLVRVFKSEIPFAIRAAEVPEDEEKLRMLEELISEDYNELWAELLDVDIYGGLSYEELTQISANLPIGTKGGDIAQAALSKVGTAYSVMDCSQLTQYAYAQAGVSLPRTSVAQAKYCYDNGVVRSKRLLNQAVGKSLRTHNLKPKKGAQVMRKNEKITALYERLSRDDFGKDDDQQRESNSISNQELLCRGWFLPPNTYDCGSFVVNGTAVVGKEPKKAL